MLKLRKIELVKTLYGRQRSSALTIGAAGSHDIKALDYGPDLPHFVRVTRIDRGRAVIGLVPLANIAYAEADTVEQELPSPPPIPAPAVQVPETPVELLSPEQEAKLQAAIAKTDAQQRHSHEAQSTAYDPDAAGHELQGRDEAPKRGRGRPRKGWSE